MNKLKKGIDFIGVSVGVMIFNEKRELFLTKRSQKTTNERGCWETPGGGVEFGEKLSEAVKREIKEEYGVEIDLLKQFPAFDHLILKEHQHWVATTFLAKFKKGQTPKILEKEKCVDIGWFPMSNLPSPLSLVTEHDINYYKNNYVR